MRLSDAAFAILADTKATISTAVYSWRWLRVSSLALLLAGPALAGRPLWIPESPPPEEASITGADPVSDSIPEGPPAPPPPTPVSPMAIPGDELHSHRPLFPPVGPSPPPDYPASRKPSGQPIGVGTWSGVHRGTGGLDGGLHIEAPAWRALRPVLQVGTRGVGVGVGVRPFLLPVTVGLSYSVDLSCGEWSPGVWVGLASW